MKRIGIIGASPVEMSTEVENTTYSQHDAKLHVSGSGFTRLELGEAWMWCSDCMSTLYSFDGNEDSLRKCPHPKKCEDDRRKLSNHYR